MSARWIAQRLAIPICSVSPSQVEDRFVGEDSKRFEALFRAMQLVAPVLLFFDEADSFFPPRNAPGASGDHKAAMVSGRLPFLAGDQMPVRGLCIIGATNHNDQVDSAVLSRLSAHRMHVKKPTQKQLRMTYLHFLQSLPVDGLTASCRFLTELLKISHPNNLRDVEWRAAIVSNCVDKFIRKVGEGLTTEAERKACADRLKKGKAAHIDNAECPAWQAIALIRRKLKKQQEEEEEEVSQDSDGEQLEGADQELDDEQQEAADVPQPKPTLAATEPASSIQQKRKSRDDDGHSADATQVKAAKKKSRTISDDSNSQSQSSSSAHAPRLAPAAAAATVASASTAIHRCECGKKVISIKKSGATVAVNPQPAPNSCLRHHQFLQCLARPDWSCAVAYDLVKQWDEPIAQWLFQSGDWEILANRKRDSSPGGWKKNSMTEAEMQNAYRQQFSTKLSAEEQKHLFDVLHMCFCLKIGGGSLHWMGIRRRLHNVEPFDDTDMNAE